MTNHALLLFGFAVAAPLWSSCGHHQQSTLPQIAVDDFVLPNGLRVILEQDKNSPLVAVAVDYGVGAADQPGGQAGFAHLFEHLLMQGSQHVSHDLQETIFEESGGDDNARTDYDFTELVSVGPSTDLETILWIQSDRMGFLLPNASAIGDLRIQKEVVTNERHQRIDSKPAALALEALVGALFPPGHPYHDLVIGPAPQLDSITLEAAEKFYLEHYRPSNAVLVIAGDFDPAAARQLVIKYFGPLASGSAPRVVAPKAERPGRGRQSRVQVNGDTANTKLLIGWATPPAFSRDEWAVRAAVAILGEGESASLRKRLVTELGIATSADCGYRPLRLASIAMCDIDVKNGVDAQVVEREFFSLLRQLADDGPAPGELRRSVTLWKASLMRDMEGVRARALRLAWYVLLTGDPVYFRQDLAKMDAVVTDDVRLAAKAYLSAERSVVVSLVPEVRSETP